MKGERRRLLGNGSRNVQFHGGTEGRIKRKVRMACACILLVQTLERVTFYSIVGNLVLFLNKAPYTWESYNAANASFFFFGISYIMSLFGGWIADSFLGRKKTILFSFVIYLGGCAFLPVLSFDQSDDNSRSLNTLPSICGGTTNFSTVTNNSQPLNSSSKQWSPIIESSPFDSPYQEVCAWVVYLALFIIGIGAGSVKAIIAPFGADQLKNAGPKAMRAFFNWFYWCVNIGAFIALGGIAYLQQQYQFFMGYLVACCCLGVATLIFLLGCGTYITRPASGSILTNVCKVLLDACRTSRGRGRASTIESDWFLANQEVRKINCLDRAKMQYGGRFTDGIVEDVKSLLKILCVFIFLIPYWMVYFQMLTTFYIQGLHMRLSFSEVPKVHNNITEHPQVAVAWLSLFDVVFVILLIPLMDRVIYPRLDKAGYHFSMGLRMILGMVFTTMAMAVAGGVETRRLQIFWPNSTDPLTNASVFQKIGESKYQAADMNVLWQIPQYALIGISEVFTSIAALQFAYSKAPKSMKGIIMGMFFFFSGIGSFLGTSLLYAFNDVWFFGEDHGNINCRFPNPSPSNPNQFKACHLDYYFYLLAGLQLFGLFLFVMVIRFFKFHRDDNQGQANTQDPNVVRHIAEDFFVGQDRPRRSGLLHGDT